MPEPETILCYAARLLEEDAALSGRHVVVTAGATREPIDPVRFVSNHSSGLMGTAIAAAAWRRGAKVTLIAGHLDVPLPVGPAVVRASTTEEMATAVRQALRASDALIMAAAPADFTPTHRSAAKLPKNQIGVTFELSPTTDILSAVAGERGAAVLVGFALETGDALTKGRSKLQAKNLDLIVVNDQSEAGAGFGGETNRVTLIRRDGSTEELPLMLKTELADVLLDRVAGLMDAR